MKQNKWIAMGLISFTGLCLTAQNTLAASDTVDTTGNVNFTVQSITEPPVGPGPVDPPGPGGTGDDLRIVYAMNFDFGNQEYSGSQAKTVFAKPGDFKQWELDDNGDIVYDEQGKPVITDTFTGPLGVSISNTNEIADWKLQVTAGQFKQTDDQGEVLPSGKTLDSGMQMSLNQLFINTIVGDAAATAAEDLTLVPGAAAEVSNYTGTKTSLNNIVFGGEGFDQSQDFSQKPVMPTNGYKGVSLYLPAGLDIKTDEYYSAQLTWSLTDTP